MIPYQGVIEKITGDLLRAGFTDFANDGSFDAAIEEVRTDIPRPALVRGDFENTQMNRFDGTQFILAPQIPLPLEQLDTVLTTVEGGIILDELGNITEI